MFAKGIGLLRICATVSRHGWIRDERVLGLEVDQECEYPILCQLGSVDNIVWGEALFAPLLVLLLISQHFMLFKYLL
jgi:hypothetical protein